MSKLEKFKQWKRQGAKWKVPQALKKNVFTKLFPSGSEVKPILHLEYVPTVGGDHQRDKTAP